MMRATKLVLCGVAAVCLAGCFDRGGLDATGDGGIGVKPDVGHATGGATGTGGAPGSGGQSATGGSKGSGGKTGSGATPGSGGGVGSGGISGTGGNRGSGGMAGSGGRPGTGGTGGASCGGVCGIFCPFGNVLDANGCPTCKCNPPVCPPVSCTLMCPYGLATDAAGCSVCKCNPPPSCTLAECGPGPLVPTQMCADGTIAGPICERDPNGKCGWVILTCPPPPNPCGTHIGYAACVADMTCTWLQPGCGAPTLAAAGCYSITSVDCVSDAECAPGQQCLKRVVNPCFDPTAMVTCDTCGAIRTVCL